MILPDANVLVLAHRRDAMSAGPKHWTILRRVLVAADARGNLVPDAHLAAIAVEHGATIATRDRGFARFGGVRWFDPLS